MMGLAKSYNVAQMGAEADGVTLSTKIIQKAIDECSASGGGVVLLDGGGSFVSGTLYMKSHVTLRIESGTTLLASPHIDDFGTDTHKNMYRNESNLDRAFIFARNAHNFAFEGCGTINGNGSVENYPKTPYTPLKPSTVLRPMMMRFVECSNIRMNDINLVDPAAWTTAWLYCDDISITGISISSRVNGNGDGLDFDGCTNVRVINSNFDNSDDCICLQTSRIDKPCKYVTISNCTFCTQWAGIRIGLLSRSEISNVTVANCTFRDINDSGLKIQQNEGGFMKNMLFTNLVMENVPRPIYMTFCQQRACTDVPEGTYEPLQSMSGFMFSNILVDNSELDENSVFVFTGLPGYLIEDVTMNDIHFIISGGGTKEQADRKDIPELTTEVMGVRWPEYLRFGGALPSSAIFARHIKNLSIDNFTVKFISPDARPLVYQEDAPGINITNLREKLTYQ